MERAAARFHGHVIVGGFASPGLPARDFLEAGQVVQLGYPPHRIDLLTSITGVSFDEVPARPHPQQTRHQPPPGKVACAPRV